MHTATIQLEYHELCDLKWQIIWRIQITAKTYHKARQLQLKSLRHGVELAEIRKWGSYLHKIRRAMYRLETRR
jgi:hypothetical protein